jgi:Gly-Xaa carboxypeptidase
LAIFVAVLGVLLLLLFTGPSYRDHLAIGQSSGASGVKSWCPLPELPPHIEDGLDQSSSFNDKDSVLKQVERLSAVVNVSTVSYDDNGDVDEDPRWKAFGELHDVLLHLFPLVSVK